MHPENLTTDLEKPIGEVEFCDQRILDLFASIAHLFKIFEADTQYLCGTVGYIDGEIDGIDSVGSGIHQQVRPMFWMSEAVIDVSIWSQVHGVSIGRNFQFLERCFKIFQIMTEEEDVVRP